MPRSQDVLSTRTVATASLPRHGADLVGMGCQRYAQLELEAEGGVRRSLDGEFLEQRCEEEEELGARQQLAQAGTLPCGDSHPPRLQPSLAAALVSLPKKPRHPPPAGASPSPHRLAHVTLQRPVLHPN